jgi:hypothetical protein
MRGQPSEVFCDAPIVYGSIATIDGGIHVLYIYIIVVDEGRDGLYVVPLYIQRSLDADPPFLRPQFAETHNLIASQQWFVTSEYDAATCCSVVEVVGHGLVEDIEGIHPLPYAVSPKTLLVQAVFAA